MEEEEGNEIQRAGKQTSSPERNKITLTPQHTQSQAGGGKKIDCTDHLKHKNALNS